MTSKSPRADVHRLILIKGVPLEQQRDEFARLTRALKVLFLRIQGNILDSSPVHEEAMLEAVHTNIRISSFVVIPYHKQAL